MIKELLNIGKDNAKTARDLAMILNITPRDVSRIIEKERRDGAPICASGSGTPGYYLASDRQEMIDYLISLFHRINEIKKTAEACRAAAEELPDY